MKKLAGVLAGFALLGVLPGCGVNLRAEKVTLRFFDDRVALVQPRDGKPIRSGEAVVTIENYTHAERQFVVARTELPANALPKELAEADRLKDHKAVVAVTSEMRAVKVDIAGFVPIDIPSVQKLHIHLHKGERYLVFDRLGGLSTGIYLELHPSA